MAEAYVHAVNRHKGKACNLHNYNDLGSFVQLYASGNMVIRFKYDSSAADVRFQMSQKTALQCSIQVFMRYAVPELIP